VGNLPRESSGESPDEPLEELFGQYLRGTTQEKSFRKFLKVNPYRKVLRETP